MDTSRLSRTLRRRGVRVCARAALTIPCLIVATAGSMAAASPVADWTQYQGSAWHAGTGTAPGPAFREAWHAAVPTGGPNQQWGLSSPVVSGDTVVAVGPEQVMGFDLNSGAATFTVARTLGPSVPPAVTQIGGVTAVVYTEGFGTEPPSALPTSPSSSVAPPTSSSPSSSSSTVSASPASPSTGPSGSPATEGPSAATSTTSQLAAFDLDTRKPLWAPIPLAQASRTGVTVDQGVAYVGDDLGTIYAVDLTKGSIEWKGTVSEAPESPVAVAGNVVIVPVSGTSQNHPSVVALKVEDGTQAWKYDGQSLGATISGVAVGADGDGTNMTVYGVFPDNTLRALSLQDGSLRWRSRLNSTVLPWGSPVVTDDAVYALDAIGQVARFDAATGARMWDFAVNDLSKHGAIVVAGGYVLAATGEGRFVAIDPGTGHLVWESGTSGSLLRSLTPTQDLVVAVRGGPDAGLVAFQHDDAGALVDVVSPTVFNAGTFARNFVVAALGFLAVTVLLGRALSARMGPAFILEDGDGGEVPVDPWDVDDEDTT